MQQLENTFKTSEEEEKKNGSFGWEVFSQLQNFWIQRSQRQWNKYSFFLTLDIWSPDEMQSWNGTALLLQHSFLTEGNKLMELNRPV